MKKKSIKLLLMTLLIMGCSSLLFANGSKEEKISVMTSMGGDLLESFELIIDNFTEETGYQVEIEVVDDISTILLTREKADNLPDVVQLAKPGQMADFVKKGKVINLNTSIVKDHPKGFVEIGTIDDNLYGVFLDASVKSLIWYRPDVFEEKGYEIPETWEELMALTAKMNEDGTTPWALGMESGRSSGWPGTDWLEDIILRQEGPEFYDKWVNHEVSWTDPRIKQAWETFGSIFQNSDYALGGNDGIVSLSWNEAPNYLFTNPPKAYMYKQGTFVQSYIQKNNPNLVSGTDYSIFALPPINKDKFGITLMGAGDIFFGFNDKPGVRELLKYIASEKAQTIIAETGQGLAVNKNVPSDIYPDPNNAEAAKILKESSNFRFDGSDLMPASVGAGSFWKGMMDYFSGKDLDTILESIEASAQEAY